MQRIKNILFYSILVSFLYSCKVSEMVKIDDITTLNGRYYTKSIPHKEQQGEYQNHLLRLLNVYDLIFLIPSIVETSSSIFLVTLLSMRLISPGA